MRMLAQVNATKKAFESSTYVYHGPTPKPSPSPPGSRFVLPPQPVVVVTPLAAFAASPGLQEQRLDISACQGDAQASPH